MYLTYQLLYVPVYLIYQLLYVRNYVPNLSVTLCT